MHTWTLLLSSNKTYALVYKVNIYKHRPSSLRDKTKQYFLSTGQSEIATTDRCTSSRQFRIYSKAVVMLLFIHCLVHIAQATTHIKNI